MTVKDFLEKEIASLEREKDYHTGRQAAVGQDKQDRETERTETQNVLNTVEAGPKAKGVLERRVNTLTREIHDLGNEEGNVAGRIGNLSSLIGQLSDLRDLL